MCHDRQLVKGPERALPPAKLVRRNGQVEFRPALEQTRAKVPPGVGPGEE
jgi:hypothetical protein